MQKVARPMRKPPPPLPVSAFGWRRTGCDMRDSDPPRKPGKCSRSRCGGTPVMLLQPVREAPGANRSFLVRGPTGSWSRISNLVSQSIGVYNLDFNYGRGRREQRPFDALRGRTYEELAR